MPLFEYAGTSLAGSSSRGRVKAPNRNELRNLLLDRGIILSSVRPARGYSDEQEVVEHQSAPKNLRPLAAGTRQLAAMLMAGMPLDSALQTLVRQSTSPSFKRALSNVSTKVRQGVPLADALSGDRAVFGGNYIELVRAGEASGQLATVLGKMAEYLEKRERARRKIKAAVAYPASVFLLSLFVVAIIMLYIIPTFSDLFSSLKVELPDSTAWIIEVSHLARHNSLVVMGVVMLTTIATVSLLRTHTGRAFVDSVVVAIPGIRTFVIKTQLATFSMTLATLLQGGVTLDKALNLASEIVRNKRLKARLVQGGDAIKRGESLNEAWKHDALLPPLFVEMASLGEQTGNLTNAFAHLSDYFELEVETLGTTITSLLEPLLILSVGLIVAAVLIAMYLPLFDLVGSLAP